MWSSSEHYTSIGYLMTRSVPSAFEQQNAGDAMRYVWRPFTLSLVDIVLTCLDLLLLLDDASSAESLVQAMSISHVGAWRAMSRWIEQALGRPRGCQLFSTKVEVSPLSLPEIGNRGGQKKSFQLRLRCRRSRQLLARGMPEQRRPIAAHQHGSMRSPATGRKA